MIPHRRPDPISNFMCAGHQFRRRISKFQTGLHTALKRLVAAAGAVLSLSAAGEIPANRQALDEAATFLADCNIVAQNDIKACHGLQQQFVFDYLRAMAGDTLSMKNMALYFRTPKLGTTTRDGVRSCSWAILAQLSPRPAEDGSSTAGMVDLYCATLGNNDMIAAKRLATVTADRIERTPARIPRSGDGDDWPSYNCDRFTVAAAARGEFAPPRCQPHVP